jgi:TolA-binding protein
MFFLFFYEEGLKYFTGMLTKYPKHPKLTETILIMGQCNEKIGRTDQAIAFYKKIVSMGGDETVIQKANQALNALGA